MTVGFWRKYGPYLLMLLAAGVAMRQWRHPGLLCGHSAIMDYERIVVFDEAVRSGDWWPRFNDVFYYGYGSLLFHFYAPLGYFIAEIFMLAGAGVALSIKLTWALALVLSGVFMIWLARDLFGDLAAAAAGALWALAPYRLVDMHVRHAFGEAIAFAWLPLAMWGLLAAVRDGRFAGLSAAALGTAALLFTHNIMAMLAAPVLFAWWLFLAINHRQQGWRGPAYGAAGVALGALLAAFFWAPAFLEKDLVWAERSLTTGFFDFHRHFPWFRELFDPKWTFGDSKPGAADCMPFQLGLAHWILLAGLPLAIAELKRARRPLIFFAAMLAWALAMCLSISEPLWRLIPTLPFVQFPWRFLFFAAFAGTLAAAAVVQAAAEIGGSKWLRLVLVPLLALPFIFYFRCGETRYLLYARDQRPVYRLVPWSDYQRLLARGLYERLSDGRTIAWIRQAYERGTSSDDYLPLEVREKPPGPPAAWIEAEHGLAYYQARQQPGRYLAKVNLSRDGVVTLNRYWYPGWRAWVDDVERPTEAAAEIGSIVVRVPAGEHEVRFAFGPTPLRRGAWAATVVALLLWPGLFFAHRRLSRGAPTPPAAGLG
jgi:hypothetical protein